MEFFILLFILPRCWMRRSLCPSTTSWCPVRILTQYSANTLIPVPGIRRAAWPPGSWHSSSHRNRFESPISKKNKALPVCISAFLGFDWTEPLINNCKLCFSYIYRWDVFRIFIVEFFFSYIYRWDVFRIFIVEMFFVYLSLRCFLYIYRWDVFVYLSLRCFSHIYHWDVVCIFSVEIWNNLFPNRIWNKTL